VYARYLQYAVEMGIEGREEVLFNAITEIANEC
jgi:hypothetical protein